MVPDPVVVAPSLNVQDFIDGVFLPTRHTAYPVVDATDRPLGLVGFRSALDVPREQWATTPVRAVMVPAAEACVDPVTPLADVMPRLAGHAAGGGGSVAMRRPCGSRRAA
jgi:CBS domain-containing protein